MNSVLRLADSHCHLNYDYSPKNESDLVREALEAGVEVLMTIGTEMATLPAIQAISEKYPHVFHTVGVHPHEAATLQDSDLKTLEKAATHPKCKAIGEIGLDYYYAHSPKEIQIPRLKDQLDLALGTRLPVVIHSRDAEPDLLPLLEAYSAKVTGGRPPGIIHCFTGTEGFALRCIELGFYISFSGILTFKNAHDLQETARKLPLESILVETDSPYLAPVPMRGKKCEPSMVKFTAQKLAELKGLSLEDVAQATFQNTLKAFQLDFPVSPNPA